MRCYCESCTTPGYGPEVDCWAIGVLVYECLVGRSPYKAGSMGGMLELIDDQRLIHRDLNTLHSITPEARNFILCCLNADPTTRLTALEMLSHPWILKHHPELPHPLPLPSSSSIPLFPSEKKPFLRLLRSTTSGNPSAEGHALCSGGGLHKSPSFDEMRQRAVEERSGSVSSQPDSPPRGLKRKLGKSGFYYSSGGALAGATWYKLRAGGPELKAPCRVTRPLE